MILSKVLKGYANVLSEISGVNRVEYFQRIPEDLAGWETIYGSDIDMILITYDSIKPNHTVTQSTGTSKWWDVNCSVQYIKEYKLHDVYELSSQFAFDTVVDNIISKFCNDVMVRQIDSVDKLKMNQLTELSIPDGGIIRSVELGKLVHVLNFEQVVTFMF